MNQKNLNDLNIKNHIFYNLLNRVYHYLDVYFEKYYIKNLHFEQ